jgi:hypothetical protein
VVVSRVQPSSWLQFVYPWLLWLRCVYGPAASPTQMMNMGRDVSSFFPNVVKIIVNENAELKQLVFSYVLQHASDNQVCEAYIGSAGSELTSSCVVSCVGSRARVLPAHPMFCA